MTTKKLTAIFMLCTLFMFAQEKNDFLDRKFWQTKPSLQTVKQKISEGNNPTALNPYGFDAVVYAILEKADDSIVKHLLTFKENDVNKLTHDKRTYVFWAAYANNVPLMKHLIANKARMDLKDSHHFSVATFAAATGKTNQEIYDVCIANGINLASDLDEHGANALLLLAPHLTDLSFVDYFISKGISMSSTDNDGNGIFNYIAKSGNRALLEKLITKGIPYNSLNKKGENALFLATKGSRNGYNSLDFIQYLEGLKLSTNITNTDGNTVLHNIAYGNKDLATFSYFLNKGIDANAINNEGNTALINAAGRNSLEVIQLLTKETSNLNHQNKKGVNALSRAVQNNSFEVVQFLINNGANVHVLDANGNSLASNLIQGYSTKNHQLFSEKKNLLIKKGVNFQTKQENDNTLFHLAIEKNSIPLFKEIKALGIDVNAKNNDGLTPLHMAVMQAKNTEIINYLISIGASKTIATDFGETVYELAKENEILSSQNIDISFLK